MPFANPELRQLDEAGYLILEGFMDGALLRELQQRVDALFVSEGERAGVEFRQEPGARRLANLVNKGEVFARIVAMPRLLAYVRHVLGPEIKLSSLNARAANPHSGRVQPLHADMGLLPDERGYRVCNTVWMLDDFTPENGAIRRVPGSHRWGRLPQEALAEPLAPHPEEGLLTGPAGTVVVMNAHLWHGGLENRTDLPRRALHAFYCRRDTPQQQYQKRLLAPEVQAGLSPALRELLALDDPLNDQLSAGGPGQSGFLK
jgi:ectoine hydroxylase-related dioxygenase (phytanoyl-CoA dioxygenase family)